MRWSHSIGYGCRGRILAKKGRTEEAARAFQQAAASARKVEYALLEAVALRDWMRIEQKGTDTAVGLKAQFDAAMGVLGHGCKPELEQLVASLFLF